MSTLTFDDDYEVPPLSMVAVVTRAEEFLRRLSASNLTAPCPLDIAPWLDEQLAGVGIDVYPVDNDELPGREAETRISIASERIEILVRSQIYDEATVQGPLAHRPRSTICHEVAHAVLHATSLRATRDGLEGLALRKVTDGQLEAFRSAEWQAYAFSAVLLMPLSTLRRMSTRDPGTLSRTFHVSPQLAELHLSRLGELLR